MKLIALSIIKFYQLVISPILGQNCRFHPSCSQHTYKSIHSHGIIKGTYLGLKQITRCHPFYKTKKESL